MTQDWWKHPSLPHLQMLNLTLFSNTTCILHFWWSNIIQFPDVSGWWWPSLQVGITAHTLHTLHLNCSTANIAFTGTETSSQANKLSYRSLLLSALFNRTGKRKRALSNKVLFNRYSKCVDHHGIYLKQWLKDQPLHTEHICELQERNVHHDFSQYFGKLNFSLGPLATTDRMQ